MSRLEIGGIYRHLIPRGFFFILYYIIYTVLLFICKVTGKKLITKSDAIRAYDFGIVWHNDSICTSLRAKL
jgi:hypothetical protein